MDKFSNKRNFCGVHNYTRLQYLATCSFVMLTIMSSFTSVKKTSDNTIIQNTALNWQLDKTVAGVDFFYAISSCNGDNVVFLKMNNKNQYSVEVSWKEVFQTQLAKDKEGLAGAKKIVLAKGETLESDCDHPTQPSLLIHSSQVDPTYVVTISKFNYKDVSVNKVK
ncbi:MAG: hypothetical protein QM802_25525 [Agriterribacter sp.]